MQNVEEGGDGIASRLANLGLFDEGIVEEGRGVGLVLGAGVTPSVFTVSLLLGRRAGNIEAHLDELVLAGAGLLAFAPRAAKVAIGAGVVVALRQGHFDSNLIAAGQVGVANLRVRYLEGWAVLNAEGELSLRKLGLAPVPAAQRVLLALEGSAIPILEDFGQALIVLLLEAVELDDG
jgi:hypothetical protein